MNCQPIGIVKSPLTDGVDKGWGEIRSEIHVFKQFAPGLKGIESFSHIIVIFEMHKSSWNADTDLVRHPQGRTDMPLVGIFVQRAKHRPNPIGVTTVQLIGVHENVLQVKGPDAIDGSPVLDAKPYFPQYEKVTNPRTPEWVDRLMSEYF